MDGNLYKLLAPLREEEDPLLVENKLCCCPKETEQNRVSVFLLL